jgi:hypothetical protein
MAMLSTYRKSCTPKFEDNSKFLSSKIHPWEYLPPCPATVGRFSSHGELINMKHLINIYNICRAQPKAVFTLWTKRKDLVNKLSKVINITKPVNLILVYSNPKLDKIMTKPPKHFDKVFNNITDHNSTLINCEGRCIDCMKCYTLGNKTKSIVEAVK